MYTTDQNSNEMPDTSGISYRESTLQLAHDLIQLYTKMSYGLCTTLASSHHLQSFTESTQSMPNSTSFEALFDQIYEQDVDTDPAIVYEHEDWYIHLHGEHCLFTSDTGIAVEVFIYDYSQIDVAFFRHFLHQLAKATANTNSESAQVLIQAIAPADFQSVLALLEFMVTKELLYQQAPVYFSLTSR
ncbi:hypothetical protein ACE3MZ_11210 [Paenibacillus sp. WLX1005]|uniref:hypothetical protein n=1 Tax=unclassified Paenibacillus TaxID=185978 RepID=UPI00398451F0